MSRKFTIAFYVVWCFISYKNILPIQSQPKDSEIATNKEYEQKASMLHTELVSERVLGNNKDKTSYQYGSGSEANDGKHSNTNKKCSSTDDGCGGSSTTDDFVSETQSKRSRWYRLLLIVQESTQLIMPIQQPSSVFPGTSYLIGNILTQNNAMVNSNGNQVGTMKMTCIRTTNFICTWTIFSARLGSDGCTFTAQGIFLPGGMARFENIPVVQYVTITGGTGQCRGLTGEIKISPSQLQAVPQTWNYEVFYDIIT
jgi:hypothetical protein